MTCFITKAPPINSIDSKCHIERLKSSKTYLIGYYSDFISREWFLIAWGWTHTRACTHTDFPDKRNFKKPGGQHAPGLKTSVIITVEVKNVRPWWRQECLSKYKKFEPMKANFNFKLLCVTTYVFLKSTAFIL